jgi:hypothetical protein
MTRNKIEKQLLGALQRMKEDAQKREHERELKTWANLSIPFSMKEELRKLTKEGLSDIRKRLDIPSASQLKKGELIDLFCNQIPLLLEKICKNLDLERFQMIEKIIRNEGYIVSPRLESHQLEYFRSIGFVFTGSFEGKKILAISEEIVRHPLFKQNNKKLMLTCSRNTVWIKLTQGLLYYYGNLSVMELIQLVEKYTNEPVNFSEFISVMEHACSYYQQFRMDQFGFSQIRVFDAERVKQEHQMRKELDYFPFSKEQLVRAGEVGYVDRNTSYLQFVDFLTKNYEISKKEADEMVEECVYATNIGEGPNQIIQFLSSRLEFEDREALTAFVEIVMNLMNNTRQWFLKGYTPHELSARNRKSLVPLPEKTNVVEFKKKIGRNDPCPCGSNKKYKNCCGK